VSRAVRTGLFLVGASVLIVLLMWGVAGLPEFGDYAGPYGDLVNRAAVPERHVTNAVAAVVFDYRALDTMVEELILFASVCAVALLLREVPAERATARDLVASEPVRALGLLAVGPTILLGLYLVAFGYITPGGGFQGGVALAAGFLLVYAAGSYRAYRSLASTRVLDRTEGIAAALLPTLGLAGLAAGGSFLENVLPLGTPGSLLGGGTIGMLNLAIAITVTAAIVLIANEFLEETAAPRRER
jgi:multicomponent Na+:H+ antiporter subunit B